MVYLILLGLVDFVCFTIKMLLVDLDLCLCILGCFDVGLIVRFTILFYLCCEICCFGFAFLFCMICLWLFLLVVVSCWCVLGYICLCVYRLLRLFAVGCIRVLYNVFILLLFCWGLIRYCLLT